MNVKAQPAMGHTAASATAAATAPVKKPTSTVYPDSPELEQLVEDVALLAIVTASSELYVEAGFPLPLDVHKVPVANGTSYIFSPLNKPLKPVQLTDANGNIIQQFPLSGKTRNVILHTTSTATTEDINEWSALNPYKFNNKFVLKVTLPSDYMARSVEGSKYIETTYHHGSRFPPFIIWGYAIQKLLETLSPNDALAWSEIFAALKLNYSLKEKFDPSQSLREHLEKKKVAFENMFNKFLQLEKTDKRPNLRILCNLLLQCEAIFPVNIGAEYSYLSLESPREYEELINILDFVEKVRNHFKVSSPLKDVEIPSFVKLLPKKQSDLSRKAKEVFEKLVSGMADLSHATNTQILLSQSTQAFNSVNRAGKKVASGFQQIFSDPLLPFGLFLHLLFFEAINIPLVILLFEKVTNETYWEAKKHLDRTIKKFFCILTVQPKTTPEASTLVKTLLQKGQTDKLFQLNIIKIMPFMQKVLNRMRNGLDDFSPLLVERSKKGTPLHNSLQEGNPFFLISEFKREITNLYAQGAKLNKLRQQVLNEFETFLLELPPEIVTKYGDDILETVEALHVHLAAPITTYFELIFGLACFKGSPHFIFSDDSTFEPVDGLAPLQDFLILKDADRVLHRVKQNANAKPVTVAPKPTPKEPLAGFSLPVPSAAPPAISAVSPEISAAQDNEDRKKTKVKTRPAIVSPDFFTAAQSKPASASDPALPYIPAPTKLRKLNQLLTALNFHYLGKGKKRDKKGNDEAKGYVTVSRGAGSKNVHTHLGSSTVKTALTIASNQG